jgi:DNA primase
MPFFSDETLQAVRSIPLYEIVRAEVELSQIGKNWRGLSPFTQEKTPSFFVLTDKNIYKCHSSGLAGDGIAFVQEMEKLNFAEAVETLAERFAIPVRYASGGAPDPGQRSLKQALLDIHEYAREFFHQRFLADTPDAEAIRSYWMEERGFSLELAKTFHIGLSPAEGNELLERLLEKKFPVEALSQSGLFFAGSQKYQTAFWRPVFRGRLMVPIRDIQGQVIAFTARQLDLTPRDHPSWKAKYINSPETPIFKKGQLLFNLDRAREAVRQNERFLLVEGQLDALRCWSAGLQEAIAPQGTSVTEGQISLIKRYTDHLDVLLDADAAGMRAILRLLPMAFAKGIQVRVLTLPDGSDPDTFIRERGADAFRAIEPESAIHFAGRQLFGEAEHTPEKRSAVLQELFRLLQASQSAVVREGYFMEAVAVSGVSMAAAEEDYQQFLNDVNARNTDRQFVQRKKNEKNSAQTLTNLEGDLLFSLLQNANWAESLAQVIDHQWIKSETNEGKILSRILAQATVDPIENVDDLYALLESDEERQCFHGILSEERFQIDMQTFVNETLASVYRRHLRLSIRQLEEHINREALQNGGFSKVRELVQKKTQLVRQLAVGPFPSLTLFQSE